MWTPLDALALVVGFLGVFIMIHIGFSRAVNAIESASAEIIKAIEKGNDGKKERS